MTKSIREHNIDIKDGEAGIFQTVQYMWNYALRDANTPLAKAKVRELKSKSKIDTIKNIYDWVWQTVSYKFDPPDYEMVTSPIHYLNGNLNTGDCDCMTTLLVCLLETAGFDSAITIIQWRVDEYTHVFAEVWYDGDWFLLDPTLKAAGFGWQDKKIRKYKRFEKKDMAKLVVLADGNNTNTNTNSNSNENENGNSQTVDNYPFFAGGSSGGQSQYERIPHRRRRCCPDSSSNNNININFGTNVENSHNNNKRKSTTDADKQQTVTMCPKTNADGEIIWEPCNPAIASEGLEKFLDNIKNANNSRNSSNSSTNSSTNSGNNKNINSGKLPAGSTVMIANGAKPRNYVAPSGHRTGYVEFP
jgi:hypothetical protein